MDTLLIQLAMIILALALFKASTKTYEKHKIRLKKILSKWDPEELSKAKYIERPYLALTYFLVITGIILFLSGINLWKTPIMIEIDMNRETEPTKISALITMENILIMDIVATILAGFSALNIWKYKYKPKYEKIQEANLYLLDVIFATILIYLYLTTLPKNATITISLNSLLINSTLTSLFGFVASHIPLILLILPYASLEFVLMMLCTSILGVILRSVGGPVIQHVFGLLLGFFLFPIISFLFGADIIFSMICWLITIIYPLFIVAYDWIIPPSDKKILSHWVLSKFLFDIKIDDHVDLGEHKAIDGIVFDLDHFKRFRKVHYFSPLDEVMGYLSEHYMVKKFEYLTNGRCVDSPKEGTYTTEVFDSDIYFPKIPRLIVDCVEFRFVHENMTPEEIAKLCDISMEHVLLSLSKSKELKVQTFFKRLKKGEITIDLTMEE